MTREMRHPRTETEKRILRVLDYIHDNPAADLSLDALADVAAMSRFHWHRIFRAMTGETAAQAVRRMRMHRAALALVETADDVGQIARAVGYANTASFARAFTEHFGHSPIAFRARNQPPREALTDQKGHSVMTEYPIEIRTEPARHLAAMPHQGPYPEIGRAFEKLGGLAGARGLFAKAGRMVGVFYDDPSAVAPDALRSHAGMEMSQDEPLESPLETVDLPAGRHAVLTFTGPYAGLTAAYDYLYCHWLPASGERPADSPAFEVYLNSPMDTPQDGLVTEVMLPLA